MRGGDPRCPVAPMNAFRRSLQELRRRSEALILNLLSSELLIEEAKVTYWLEIDARPSLTKCTLHSDTKLLENWTKIFLCPRNSEASEGASERNSERVSERCGRTNEQMKA